MSISGLSEVQASITDERVDRARSGGAYAATTNPPASARTDAAASGKALESRRLSSSGVSPGFTSAPASLASTSVRFQTAATLRGRYPEWDRFQAVRARLDPSGRFANRWTDRVLGPSVAEVPA